MQAQKLAKGSGSQDDPANVSPTIIELVKYVHHELLPDLSLDFQTLYPKLLSNMDGLLKFIERV